MKSIISVLLLTSVFGYAPMVNASTKHHKSAKVVDMKLTGTASWYGIQHHGHKTASGEIFNMNKLTAAHRTIKLGTMVRVTNLSNGRQTLVKINDRGPYAKGRILDLSKQAAKELDMLKAGEAKVAITII